MIEQPPLPTEAASPPGETEKPWPPWTFGDIVICVLGGLLLGFILIFLTAFILGGLELSDSVYYTIFGTEIYVTEALIIWLRIGKGRGVTLRDLGFRAVKPGALFLMIPLTVALLIVAGIVAELTASLFGNVPDAEDQLGVTSAGLSVVDLVCLLFATAVIAPIAEEVVFRGLLYQLLRARKGASFAVFVSAVAFSVIHFIPLLLGVFIVMGIAFALVAEHYQSLYPAILLHALSNALATWVVYINVN